MFYLYRTATYFDPPGYRRTIQIYDIHLTPYKFERRYGLPLGLRGS